MATTSGAAALSAVALLTGLPLSAVAQTQQFLVDCTAGKTISAAIAQGDPRKPLVVTVRGQCNENVSITRDDVTLRGDYASWGGINGASPTLPTLSIEANRVTVESLIVTGGQDGIFIHAALNAVVNACTIFYAGRDGIRVQGAHARIQNNMIGHAEANGLGYQSGRGLLSNNRIEYNKLAGVYLQQTSNINAFGNTIRWNGSNGVGIHFNSHASLYSNTISGNGTGGFSVPRNGIEVRYSTAALFDGNTVANNVNVGVQVYAGRVSIVNSTIVSNGMWGLSGDFGSSIDIRGGSVAGNTQGGIAMRLRSNLQLAGAAITSHSTYGVRLRLGSALLAVGPTSYLTDNGTWGLECQDAESSVSDPAFLAGAIDTNCTGF